MDIKISHNPLKLQDSPCPFSIKLSGACIIMKFQSDNIQTHI